MAINIRVTLLSAGPHGYEMAGHIGKNSTRHLHAQSFTTAVNWRIPLAPT